MPDLLLWFIEKILPWITIAVCGGGFTLFRRVDKLNHNVTTLTKDFHRMTEIAERKWKDVDDNVREDVKELKTQIDYMTKHHISRAELNQYLSNLNSTVDRLTNTLNKFL